jgi:biotin operon repressor
MYACCQLRYISHRFLRFVLFNKMINRHATSPFWTPQTDTIIQKLHAAGVPLEQLAAKLDVTPNSVQRRLYHLRTRGISLAKDKSELPTTVSKLPKEKRARQHAVLAAMRSAIKDGMWRDRAICEAAQRGGGTEAIADALGVSRQTIYSILTLQSAPERELKERARKRRKERKRVFRPAMDALRGVIGRGVPRDRAIVEAYASGLTLQAIGNVFGLTRERIRQIIARHDSNA